MEDYLVRASALQGIRAAVTELGGEADTLFKASGLAPAESDPEAWISYRAFLLLLEAAAQHTGNLSFGLYLSRYQGVEILGALGFVIRQAADIRTALQNLAMHFGHHNQGGSVSLRVEAGVARWGFTCKLEGKLPIRQQSELAMGIGVDVMRLLTSPGWSPRAVYLAHSPPENLRPYRERFNCPVYFNWECTEATFDAAELDKPIREADPQLHRVLEQHLAQAGSAFFRDVREQTRHLIHQAMTTGDCSIDRVAGFMGINKRTLQRQLQAEQTGFRELLDDVRFSVARRYLLESSGSLTALADMLCYSDLSAFSNAFRAHFGTSPREWRKLQQPG